MTSGSRTRSLSEPAVPRTKTPARPRICSTIGSPPSAAERRSRVADSGERTAAEREAARLERERRRQQQRLGEPASPEVAGPAEVAPSAETDSPAYNGD